MAGKSTALKPRGDTRSEVERQTRHRANALIGQALDLIVTDKQGRDPAKRLSECYWDDPRGFIDWVNKRTGGDDAQAGIAGAAGAAFAGIFAGAAAQAAATMASVTEPEQLIVDVTPRVQSGCDDDEAIDW